MKNNKTNMLKMLNVRLKLIKAEDIMTKTVITTTEDATLADLAKLMIDKRITGVPVLGRTGKLKGIVTATDLFVIMDMIQTGDVIEKGRVGICNPTVKFAMSTDIITVKKNTTLDEIISIMQYRSIHTIPVVNGSRIVGIIGRRDAINSFYSMVMDIVSS